MKMEERVNPKVVERIHKLLALAQCGGATEAEAENAMARAQDIMAKHNLSMAEIEAAGGSSNSEGGQRNKDMMSGSVLYDYQQKLMGMVAYVNFTHHAIKQYWDKESKKPRWRPSGYELIGRQANVIATRTTFEYLNATITRLAREFVGGDHKRLMSRECMSFKKGMSDRLIARLWGRYQDILAKEKAEQDAKANSSSNTANALAIRLEDVAQKERDFNFDMAYGYEPGTTAARRAKLEAERAMTNVVEEVQMTEEEKAKQAKWRARQEKKWERQRQRDAANINWDAYGAGEEAASKLSLDKQIDRSSINPNQICGE
jgi:Protein of unknown function (DUF2786)